MKIVQISCGENHTLALVHMPNEDKEPSKKLFVWGNNDKM
jgi:alpha-tubulin suppressor-like RCC1 family protein